jgi:uncharacterized protein
MKKLLLFLLVLLGSVAFLSAQTGPRYVQAIEQHRREYRQKFLLSENSPLDSAGVERLRFFPAAERYRLDCAFVRTPDAEPFDLPTYSGITKPYVKYGEATFSLGGATYTLALYQNLQGGRMTMYRDLLFVPFKDQTNGQTTYGGGRYLDVRISSIQDGRITLDLNRAYNPFCAYSEGYNCPIPPPENHLPVSIEAGEMQWAGALD